jgi:hypothetical protein
VERFWNDVDVHYVAVCEDWEPNAKTKVITDDGLSFDYPSAFFSFIEAIVYETFVSSRQIERGDPVSALIGAITNRKPTSGMRIIFEDADEPIAID